MKQILRAALLGGVAVFALPARAEPVLRADVSVASEIVTVGDMFENAGLFAEQPLFRAPAPGTTGFVSLLDVEAAANRAGLPAFSVGGVLEVRVERLSSTVDESTLRNLITERLAEQGVLTTGVSATTVFGTPITGIVTAYSAEPAQMLAFDFSPSTGAFTAHFSIAGRDMPLSTSGTIALTIEAPHLATSLPAGAVIGAEDLVMRPVPLRTADASGFLALDQVIGQALTRPSREGLMLRASDLKQPDLVGRNQEVTLFLQTGPMTLTIKGLALNSAAEGQPVAVLNRASNKIVNGIAVSAGTVAVSAGPQNVAGL